MSRSGRSTSRPFSRPRTGLPTPRRRLSAGGDTPINLDEELQNVLQKEYDDSETGKKEAIHDAKTVLKEVSMEPMAQAMDRAMPRFYSAETDATPPKKRPGSAKRSKTPRARHAMLTARPPARGKQFQATEETFSVPNIPDGLAEADGMRVSTSAPTIGSTTRQLSSSSSYVTDKTSWSNLKVTGMEDLERPPRTTSALSSITDVSIMGDGVTQTESLPRSYTSSTSRGEDLKEDSDDEELPYTENLLEMPSDSEDEGEVWKSDIVEITKMKSGPRGKSTRGTDTLELKYKEPEWPHQLLLNQILAKLPRLTHLVLDGSELRFLRDLGSSLMSLITLSICDCGLRSLDGIYAMPNLRTLIARKNKITIPTQCSFLNRLSYLDLSSNPITSFDQFGCLRLCGELRILKLHDTPIASNPKFNKRMKRLVPQLKEIHPPYFDAEHLKFLRKDEEEEDTGKLNKEGATMPSLSYSKVMLEEKKSGIAYQQIPVPEEKKKVAESDTVEVNMGMYMAPRFLQHLEETIPPTTAETDDNNDEVQKNVEPDNNNNIADDESNEKPIKEIYRR